MRFLGLKRIDGYIIKQFLGTFIFAMCLLTLISVVFDVNEKIDKFLKPELTLKEIIFDYYFNFIPWFFNMVSPLITFIAVIFFTSRLAANSEIIAMLSSGMSFRRLIVPYFVSAAVIALATALLNAFVIPVGNVKRIDFQNKYFRNRAVETVRNMQLEVEPGVIAYFDQYIDRSRMGYRFSLDHFEDKKLVSHLTAKEIKYDTLYKWQIIDYVIRDFDGMYERISSGSRKDTTIRIIPSDFLIAVDDCETMTTPELSEYISRQKKRGIANIQTFEIEYNKRYAAIMAAFILTTIGVSLSSKKMKGGMGLKIGIGIGLSFSYILFTTISSTFAVSGLVSPMVAAWIPNILYSGVAVILYVKAPR
ncbi:MAG: LptF/LptG family permease [Tannerellaceae bacterium]|jgi:lipopolysaccharide export system permease protein|nr:LptF/LptG family permease [Tannerellaceae bacterium]